MNRPAEAQGARAGLPASGEALPGGTTERILRVLLLTIAASIVLFGALLAPAAVEQLHATAGWWLVTTVAVLLASVAGAVAVAVDGRAERMRTVAGAVSIALTLLALLRLPAQIEPVDEGQVPWIINIGALSTTAAAIAFRPAIAWLLLLLGGIISGAVRWHCGPEQEFIVGLQNGVQAIGFCSIFLLLVDALLRAGRDADRALVNARRHSAAQASRRASLEMRERIGALIHDRVLATLLSAGRAADAEQQQAAARSALDALEALAQQREAGDLALTATELTWQLQGLVRDLDPDTQFSYEIDDSVPAATASARQVPPRWQRLLQRRREQPAPALAPRQDTDGRVPAEVADAIIAAALEALRNSLRHATRAAGVTTRAVHVRSHGGRLQVTVLDDGVGFDPQRVDTSRLGIAGSIHGRMSAVGGTTRIVSVPGQGTRVALDWDGESAAARLEQRRGRRQQRSGTRSEDVRSSPFNLDFWIGPPAQQPASPATERPRLQEMLRREFLLVFGIVQSCSNLVLAITSDPARAASWPSILALTASMLGLGLIAWPGANSLSIARTTIVLLATASTSLLMSLILPAGEDPGYRAWHFGANTLTLLGLALRGRIGASWIGMAAMILTTLAWFAWNGQSLALAVPLLDRNIATLLVGSICGVALRRTVSRTIAVERALERQLAQEAAAAAALAERDRILRRFDDSALPALREIATGVHAGHPAAAERRRSWLVLEARLRDRIRAPALDAEPLRSAVERARGRDVRVVVLDDTDGAPLPAPQLAALLERAARRVDEQVDGDLTLRLRASVGGIVLTIVGDGVEELRGDEV